MRWNVSYLDASGAIVKEVVRFSSAPFGLEQIGLKADEEMLRVVGPDGGWIASPDIERMQEGVG